MKKFITMFVLLFAFLVQPVFAGVTIFSASCDNPIITIDYTEPSPAAADLAYCTAHIDVNGGTVFNKQINANTSTGGEARSENHSVGGLTVQSNDINVSMSCSDTSTPPNTDGPTAVQIVNIQCDLTGPGLPTF